ncbi:ICP0-binding domain of ubiquitin-specific protease 7, partial [Mycena pura]
VEIIRNKMATRQNDLRLYLDIIEDPSKPDPPPQSVMIFLKHFDSSKQTLHGAGKVYMSRMSKVGKLAHVINQRMRWTPSTPLQLYEASCCMEPNVTFAQRWLHDGDIICFQIKLRQTLTYDMEREGLHSTLITYYDFLQHRVLIVFRPKSEEVDKDHTEFSLVLSKKQNYDIMSQKAGEYLRHNPIKLRFTSTHARNGSPKAILKRALNQTIAEIMGPNYINTIILYEKLDVSIVELETE